jgi:hypothetical protein
MAKSQAQTLSTDAAQALSGSFEALRLSVFNNLAAQTRLKVYLDQASVAGGVYDFTAVETALAALRTTDAKEAVITLLELGSAQFGLKALGWEPLTMASQWMKRGIAANAPCYSLTT